MISILSMCIVHSNHCNVIVDVFVVLFILFCLSSLMEPLTMHRGAQGLRGTPVGQHWLRIEYLFALKYLKYTIACFLALKTLKFQLK